MTLLEEAQAERKQKAKAAIKEAITSYLVIVDGLVEKKKRSEEEEDNYRKLIKDLSETEDEDLIETANKLRINGACRY